MTADMASMVNDVGELQVEEDDELNLGQISEADLEAEEREEPEMMKQAGYWDNFLALEREAKRPWAHPGTRRPTRPQKS